MDDDWLRAGIAERKLTHIMDFIDSAIYLKDKWLTDKIGIHASGESGSITALSSIFQEPLLFESAVVVNPIVDLVNHLLFDIEDRQLSKNTDREHDIRHFDKLEEFGDPQNPIFYQATKLISPYHMPPIVKSQMHTDLLISVDEEFPYLYHSRKLICKLRELYNKDNSWIFYREFGRKSMTPDQKYAMQASFLVNSLLFG